MRIFTIRDTNDTVSSLTVLLSKFNFETISGFSCRDRAGAPLRHSRALAPGLAQAGARAPGPYESVYFRTRLIRLYDRDW